jgi:hypothetical protein
MARALLFRGADTSEQLDLERGEAMSQREANLLWLRDILEHVSATRQKLEWAEDRDTIRVLTESMIRDLERCQRLCEAIGQKSVARSVAS